MQQKSIVYLALPLFVARLGATDDANRAVALDDLAVAADLFDRCSDFHFINL